MPADSLETIAARRHELLKACRVFPDGDLQKQIEAGEVIADDLTWLLERLDEQRQETPHHVKDSAVLEKSLANLRHCRTVVAQTLGNKRTIENREAIVRTDRRANAAIAISVAALILTLLKLILG